MYEVNVQFAMFPLLFNIVRRYIHRPMILIRVCNIQAYIILLRVVGKKSRNKLLQKSVSERGCNRDIARCTNVPPLV